MNNLSLVINTYHTFMTDDDYWLMSGCHNKALLSDKSHSGAMIEYN